MEKSMIIVGAGIAGLSTACYARMNGYRTTIFEMHSIPGGLCTAWKRKGYTWDISMHLLTCSRKGPFHRMLDELGITGQREFHYHTEFTRIEGREVSLPITTNRRALENAMIAIAPDETATIREFTKLLFGKGMIAAGSDKPQELMSPLDGLRMFLAIVPMIPTLVKYSKLTVQDVAKQFRHPFLSKAVQYLLDSPGWRMLDCPAVTIAGFLDSAMTQAGVPMGGSQQVMFDLADRVKSLGGTLVCNTRVKDLIIENGAACGVRLDNGEEHRADIVVWAADGRHLIFDLLGGRYLDDTIRKMYTDWKPVLPLVQVVLGVNRDMTSEPVRRTFELDTPITIAGEEHRWMFMLHHGFDPSAAPAGKSAVEVWYSCDFDYWEKLSADRSAYAAEKERIAGETVRALDKKFPGFASQVEVVDVATPVTYVRYTGNWRGSPDGWYITNDNMMQQKPVRTLPGLNGLYTVGQWTMPYTGTIMAALTGRQLIQILCKKEKQRFRYCS